MVGNAADDIYVWAFGGFALLAILKWTLWGSPDHAAVRRDLERRGCHLLHLKWLPSREGLLIEVNRYDPACDHGMPAWGKVYRVTYRNRTGETLEAVCEMGPGRSVHWTDEHREPGYDRMGDPPSLSTYGSEWRG